MRGILCILVLLLIGCENSDSAMESMEKNIYIDGFAQVNKKAYISQTHHIELVRNNKGDIWLSDTHSCPNSYKLFDMLPIQDEFIGNYQHKKVYQKEKFGDGFGFSIDIDSHYVFNECVYAVFDDEAYKMMLPFRCFAGSKGIACYFQDDGEGAKKLEDKINQSKKYYLEAIFGIKVDSKDRYFKGRWFFGGWGRENKDAS